MIRNPTLSRILRHACKIRSGVHVNGRDIKAEIVDRFGRQLSELDWLASQIVDGLGVHQDASQEVQSLGDTDGTYARANAD